MQTQTDSFEYSNKVSEEIRDRERDATFLSRCLSRDYIHRRRVSKAIKETDGKRASAIHQHDQRSTRGFDI